eukprot:5227586-Pyramimonas_sp.AAC.1
MERDQHGRGRNAGQTRATGLQMIVTYKELGETEAHAVRKGPIPDGRAALGTARRRGCGCSLALGGCAEDSQ